MNTIARSNDSASWSPEMWTGGVLTALALLLGWSLPDFYDWTGADQSSQPPVIGRTALGLFAVNIVLWVMLLGQWNRRPNGAAAGATVGAGAPLRLMTRSRLQAAAAALAVAVLVGGFVSWTVACWLLSWLTAGSAVWLAMRHAELRWPVVVLLTCQWAPFLWIFRWRHDVQFSFELLAVLGTLPGLLPAAGIGHVMNANLHDIGWLAALLSALELTIGIAIIRIGANNRLAYCLGVLTLSLFGSFGFHALLRA